MSKIEKQEAGYWIVAGGLNLDILAKPTGDFRLRDSNPGHIGERPGGVGFNIVRNLALLDEKVFFLTAAGDDRAGHFLLERAEEKGIDMSRALTSDRYPTSRYLAVHDPAGDMAVAINDMALFDSLKASDVKDWISLAPGCLGAIIEPNLPGEVLFELAANWKIPLFADAVSQAKMDRLLRVLPFLTGYKLNRIEAEHLTGIPIRSAGAALEACHKIRERGVSTVCVSLDIDGAVYANGRSAVWGRPARLVADANTTGAGDAMATAFAWAAARGASLEETARLGLAASSMAVESEEAVNPLMTAAELNKRAEEIEIEVLL